MRMAGARASAAIALLLACATSAAAQQSQPRGFLEIGGATHLQAPASVTQDRQFTEFLETAEVTSVVRQNRGARLGVRAGWWLTPRLGVAAEISVLHASGTVQGSYAFPSPFVFNAPVTATASAPVTRTSIDADIDLIFSLVDARGWQIIAGVGPDIAHVDQPLLADVFAATYEFPFTSIDLAPASGESHGTAFGLHTMASISRHVGRHLDLVATVDFRRAPVRVTTEDGTVKVDAGGAAVGGALRVRF
jgi:hypothetical protein